jgi:RNA polymerase sigma-70 factor (sigma-E family)
MSGRADRDEEFRAFVVGSQSRLLRLADMLTGDRGRAEDLVQHAYVKTYLAWRRVGLDNPERYARRVIANANIDWWRRRPWRERSDVDMPDRPAPDDHADDHARRRLVLDALSQLTVRERRVVVLRYYCDLSEQDVARELGCALGTVKSTAARALAKLKNDPALRPEVSHGNVL